MICHNKRVTELRKVENLLTNAEPLIIVVAVFLTAIFFDGILSVRAATMYASEINAASAFASALNGDMIDTGEEIITCKVNTKQLVKGL